jgi:nicotinamide mononucleotide transporter
MQRYLAEIHDSAPMLDSLTTCMSLAAQYLLTRRLIENWPIWIAADIIYVGLYGTRHLYLTAVLYALFIVLCLMGYFDWREHVDGPAQEVPEVARA